MPALRVPRHKVFVQYASGRAQVPLAAHIHRWARAALLRAGRSRACEVTVRIVDEAEGAQLNRVFRGRECATNVLSFGYADAPACAGPIGDIVLCAPIVRAEARALQGPPAAHWAHLVVHGIMHLCGHDHEQPDEAAAMEALEIRALADLGYGNPY